MYNSYFNNLPYGESPYRPIYFTVSEKTVSGVKSVVLTSEKPFFDELKCGCRPCSVCYAVITGCLEYGVCKPVFITDDGGCTYIPLRTKNAGFEVYSDSLAGYIGSRQLIKLLDCYDDEDVDNNHINILSPIAPRHYKCDCNCSNDDKEVEDPQEPVVRPTIATATKTTTTK